MGAITRPRVRDIKYMIIYKATNLINNKVYIGQTINTLEYRKSQHLRDARLRPRNIYFHNAIHKYGEENFVFEVIDTANRIEELNDKEEYWIKFYNSTNEKYGYNLDSGGNNNKKSERTKKLIGQSTKDRWKDPETALKMRNGLRKGVESQKKNKKRVDFVCPYCHVVLKVTPSVARKRKCCVDCLPIYISQHANKEKISAGVRAHNEIRFRAIREDAVKWCIEHKEKVLNCPYNKIITNLQPMLDILKCKHGVNDIRTLCKSFYVNGRKDLLTTLKNILNENIC